MSGATHGLAPAKVNLFLHVGAVDAGGLHPLSSLVAFADIGDQVTVEPSDALSLAVEGPFSDGLAEPDNLVLRALRSLGEASGLGDPPLKVVLNKALPVAAGLGGGSSDAGAALRLAREALDLPIDDATLAAAARTIGADGPMCLRARAAWAEGHGDILIEEPRLPPLPAVLVNPGAPSSTGAVYRAYDEGPTRQANRDGEPTDWSVAGVTQWLRRQRNDLTAPAVALQPLIGRALEAVAATPGVALARMSGSGATVFGLCPDAAAADRAAAALSAAHPAWWVRKTILN